MAIGETVVANLTAKLLLDASGFTQNSESVTSKLETWANRFRKIGTVATAAATTSVKAAMDFETAFTGVTKTIEAPEKTNADQFFHDLRSEILEMSSELPVAATEIAGVYQAAGQLGISSENLTTFSRAMLQLSSATNLTSEEAATSLAQFANVMQTDQTQFENMGSAIVALGNNFATNEKQVVSFAQEMAIAGKLMGLSEADVLGFGTAMASMGLEAASSGTAFQRFGQTITEAVATGNGNLTTLAQTAGMTTEEFKTAWETNATGALLAFLDGLGQLSSADQLTVFDNLDIAQQQEITMLQSLASNTNLVKDAVNTSNEAWAENTALAKEADTANATTAAQFQLLKNNITQLAIAVGTTLLPIVNDILEAITPLIEKFKAFAEEHPGIVKAAILVGLALGAIGSVITALLPIISMIAGAGGLAAIGTALGGILVPALPVIGVIALLVAGFLLLKTAIENNFLGLGDRFEELKEKLSQVKESIKGYWSDIKAEFEQNGLEGVLVKLGQDAANLITQAIEGAFNLIGDIGASAIGLLQDAGTNIKNEISSWWDSSEAGQAISSYCEEVKIAFENGGIVAVLEKFGQDAVTLVGAAIEGAFNLFGDIGNSALQIVQDAWSNIQAEFLSWASDNPAVQAVTEFVNKVISFFQNLYDTLVGHSIVPDLIQGVIGCFTGWWDSISPSIEAVKNGIVDAFNGIWSKVSEIAENIKNKLQGAWNWVKKLFHAGGEEDISESQTIDMPENMVMLDYDNLQPIPENVLTSYEQFKAAIEGINTAIQSINESLGPDGLTAFNSFLGIEIGDDQLTGWIMLNEVLGTTAFILRDLMAVMTGGTPGTEDTPGELGTENAGTKLAEGLILFADAATETAPIIESTLNDVLLHTHSYVFGIRDGFLSIISIWTGTFKSGVKTFKKYGEIAEATTQNLTVSANAAAAAYKAWADAIWDVINALAQLGSRGGGSSVGVPTALAKASGGPVRYGNTYLVGEEGPELFTPSRSGYIIPNDELTAGRGDDRGIKVEINGSVYGESYLEDYVVKTIVKTIRKELSFAG